MHSLIARSFKRVVSGNALLNADLPGDLHYGRVDTRTVRPFGTLAVTEKGREYNSGGGALVQYEVTLKVYGRERARAPDLILLDFADVFDGSIELPGVTDSGRADVVSIVPTAGLLEEDDAEQYGKDCVTASTTWLVMLNESKIPFEQ